MMTKKKRFSLLAVSILFVVVLAFFSLNTWFNDRSPDIQEIKLSSEPDVVAEMFVKALAEDNITLAKGLVSLDTQERIERWEAASQPQNNKCKFDWAWFVRHPLEIQKVSWASTSSVEKENNTVEVTSSLGCNSNLYSIKVDQIVVQQVGGEWVIIDWNRICENVPSETSEKCYE
jgi:hypothetical protein